MPGFRKGKAPPSLVIQRLGFGAVLQEAVVSRCPSGTNWRCSAPGSTRSATPKIEMVPRPSEGEPLAFKFEVGVRPEAKSVTTRAWRSARPTEVPATSTASRAVRESFAGWSRSSAGRPTATAADRLRGFIDGAAFEGGRPRTTAQARLRPLIEASRAAPGPRPARSARSTSPSRRTTRPSIWPAKRRSSKSRSRRCGEVLPELDDEFAADATEFETLEELRADIGEKLGAALGSRADRVPGGRRSTRRWMRPRSRSGGAGDPRATERWERLERQIAGPRLEPDDFLQMQGKKRDELIEETKEDAEKE